MTLIHDVSNIPLPELKSMLNREITNYASYLETILLDKHMPREMGLIFLQMKDIIIRDLKRKIKERKKLKN